MASKSSKYFEVMRFVRAEIIKMVCAALGVRVRSRSNTKLVALEAVTAWIVGSDFFSLSKGRYLIMLESP